MRHGDSERVGERGGIAPFLLGGALLVLICVLAFGSLDVMRAMEARSSAVTALRAALRAAATATVTQAAGDAPPAWEPALATERFQAILAENLHLDAQGNPVDRPNLLGPVTYELQLLSPGDVDPQTGAGITAPAASAVVAARLPLLVLSRFTGGPVPLRVAARVHLVYAEGRWRIADN